MSELSNPAIATVKPMGFALLVELLQMRWDYNKKKSLEKSAEDESAA